ncbi:hypothetical protein B0O80DRAFT_503897 [Mortierella sp. GBAus27b]|nr:hypothetical protein B0O80DRAFT_503897 [Mortierella sp. GBAus27b]
MSRSKMDMAINLAEERRNHKVLAGLEHHIIQDELRGGLLNTLESHESAPSLQVLSQKILRHCVDKVSKKPTARFELGKDFGTSDRKTNLTKLLFIKVKGGHNLREFFEMSMQSERIQEAYWYSFNKAENMFSLIMVERTPVNLLVVKSATSDTLLVPFNWLRPSYAKMTY